MHRIGEREDWYVTSALGSIHLKPHRILFPIAALALPVLLLSCGGDPPEPDGEQAAPQSPAVPETAPLPPAGGAAKNVPGGVANETRSATPVPTGERRWTEPQFHEAIRKANPRYTGSGQIVIEGGVPVVVSLANEPVSDISPLAGLKLQALDLSQSAVQDLTPLKGMGLKGLDLRGSKVTDLSPLAGMPIEELFLEETAVEDLTPLRSSPLKKLSLNNSAVRDLTGLDGVPLEEFNAFGTRVADLTPLKGAPLKMVWLTGCPVSDLGPLAGAPLVSLTLQGTAVSDLGPLASSQLQRIHIAGSKVEDLTPLANVPLTRLVFTPALIKSGIEAVRKIPTMIEIGTRFEDGAGGLESDLVPPGKFWPAYDAFTKQRDGGG